MYQKTGSSMFLKIELLSLHMFDNIFNSTGSRFKISESSLWGGVGVGYRF